MSRAGVFGLCGTHRAVDTQSEAATTPTVWPWRNSCLQSFLPHQGGAQSHWLLRYCITGRIKGETKVHLSTAIFLSCLPLCTSLCLPQPLASTSFQIPLVPLAHHCSPCYRPEPKLLPDSLAPQAPSAGHPCRCLIAPASVTSW